MHILQNIIAPIVLIGLLYEPGKTVSLDPNISIVVPEDRDGLYAIDCLDPDMVRVLMLMPNLTSFCMHHILLCYSYVKYIIYIASSLAHSVSYCFPVYNVVCDCFVVFSSNRCSSS